MNEPVLFLLGAVALSALGGLIVWVLSRPRREKFGNTIDTFSRDLSALAPPGRGSGRKRGRQRRPVVPPGLSQTPNVRPPRPNQARSPQGSTSTPAKSNRQNAARPGKVVQTSPRPRPGPRPRQEHE